MRDLKFVGYSSKVFEHHVAIEFSCPVELCRINEFIFMFFILFSKTEYYCKISGFYDCET